MSNFPRVSLLIAAVACCSVLASPQVSNLRGNADLNQQQAAPPLAKVINNDQKLERAYPQQPPVIPHHINGYQVDKDFNKCMSCHSRKNADEFQAPAISVTHYINRSGEYLSETSPRRYFCTQCHVVQKDARIQVNNEFLDVYELIDQQQ